MNNYSRKDLSLNKKTFNEHLIAADCLPFKLTGPTKISDDKERFIIHNSISAETYLDLFHKTNGLTSLSISGTMVPLELIAHVEKCIEATMISSANSFDLIVPHFEYQNFELMIDYLTSLGYIIENIEHSLFFELKVKSEKHESITVKYYKTNSKLHCQGKPNSVYNNLYDFIVEFFPEITFYDSKKGTIKVDIDKKKLSEEILGFYPCLNKCKSELIQNLINTSYIMMKIDIDAPDYSFQLIPIMRAIEGLLKVELFEKDIIPTKKDGFKSIFYFNPKLSKHEMNSAYISLYNTVIRTKLENMYTFYNIQRHSIVHTGIDVKSTRMLDMKDTRSIFDTAIKLISEYYELKNE